MLNLKPIRITNLVFTLAGLVSPIVFLSETAIAAVLSASVDNFSLLESRAILFSAENIADPSNQITNVSIEVNNPNQVLELLVTQKPPESLTNFNNVPAPSTETNSLSFSSIFGSLQQLRLNPQSQTTELSEVLILPQTTWGDIYQGIYDFNNIANENSEESIDSIVFDPFSSITPESASDSVETDSSPLVGTDTLPSSVFGVPRRVFSIPQINFAVPLGEKSLPSATGYQGESNMDSMINVFFASVPKEQVVNLDIFLRTIYRTNPREMVEQIDKSLDLTIDTELQLMPKEVFDNIYQRIPTNFAGSL
ncbi:MAG TPA: hypothetical protein DCF68_13745 [Cyanothece sp. UBA12306]|nr:hypothetical protein [Cyanothece sp. UBA12306]